MSECVQSGPPAISPNRSKKARREARLAKFERERLVVEYLNRGVSVPEIAAQMGVTEKRMRALVREILARRMPAPPAEFLAMQVSRLNEALLVAYSAMKGLNLRAVDRVVKIVRELDRYHGFAAAERHSRPDASRLEAPPPDPLALLASLASGAEMALQRLDKVDFAPGNGTAREIPDAEDAAPGLGEAFALRLEASEQDTFAVASSLDDRPEITPQRLDEIDSAPGNGAAAGASDPRDAARGLDEAFAGPAAANSICTTPNGVVGN